jgi:hypothetical protein
MERQGQTPPHRIACSRDWRQISWRLAPGQDRLNPEERTLICEAIEYFDGQQYRLAAYAVTDDRVVVVAQVRSEYPLPGIVRAWRVYTEDHLRRTFGRQGDIWSGIYNDRALRTDRHFAQALGFIASAPRHRPSAIGGECWVRILPPYQHRVSP